MAKPKSKEYISDSDGSSGHPPKKAEAKKRKMEKDKPATTENSKKGDKAGKEQIELGKNKFVTINEFRGARLVDIREFYVDKASGDQKPGKKGISLNKEQWKALKEAMDEIDERLNK